MTRSCPTGTCPALTEREGHRVATGRLVACQHCGALLVCNGCGEDHTMWIADECGDCADYWEDRNIHEHGPRVQYAIASLVATVGGVR